MNGWLIATLIVVGLIGLAFLGTLEYIFYKMLEDIREWGE